MTDRDQWQAVDDYFSELFVPEDAGLAAAREASRRGDVPAIEVSPAQGKLLELFARMVGARRILELGTLAGYSGVWLARGLAPGGRLVTCEFEQKHADIAADTFAKAGVADRVEIRVGAALDTLDAMIAAGDEPFDLVFIDADKGNYPHYLDRVVHLSRLGTVILGDNVVQGGQIVDESIDEPRVAGMRSFLQRAAQPGLSSTALQFVGSKGWNGLSITIVD